MPSAEELLSILGPLFSSSVIVAASSTASASGSIAATYLSMAAAKCISASLASKRRPLTNERDFGDGVPAEPVGELVADISLNTAAALVRWIHFLAAVLVQQ